MNARSNRVRVAAVVVVSAAVFVPLAVFSGAGFASSSAAQYQYKVTICHHTSSATHPFVTIRIASAAWKAHRRHHDTLGACPATTPASASTAASTAAAASTAPVAATTGGSSPGQSGESHGQSGESHGQSGESHGQSASAPGHNK